MAKKTNGPNKSQAIRDYYAANPEAKPKQVVEALAAQGVDVSAAFVSTIKSTSMTKGSRKAGGKRGPRAAKAGTDVLLAVENMFPWRAGGSGMQAYLPHWDPVDLDYATTESGAYPIVLVAYHIVCSEYDDADRANLVKDYLGYVASEEGQQAAADAAGSAPISAELREQVMSSLSMIQGG